MTELREVLHQCAARIEKHRDRGHRPINEANTKASLIEVMLRALGWDTTDTDEVDREYRHGTRHNPTDYALILPDRHDRPCAVVEAKALGSRLDDPRVISQALGYAIDTGAPCAVITDGDAWHLYNAHATEPGRDRLYRAVSISRDGDAAAEVLSLLTKDELRANTLQTLWRREHADKQVETALKRLFDSSGPDHHRLVTALVPLLPDTSEEDLRDSLARLRPLFSFSRQASAAMAAPSPAERPKPENPATVSSRSYRPVSEIERSLTVHDLLAAHRLFPGRLEGRYKKVLYTAELMADGSIRYDGIAYPSPSAAAKAVKNSVTDRGWNFWYTENHVDGDRTTLLEIRRRYAEALSGGKEE